MANDFWTSLLNPKNIKKYLVEIVLISVSVILTIVSTLIYLSNNLQTENDEETSIYINKESQKIFVDLSGEIKKPDVYEVASGERLHDIIKKAGGLTENADNNFFYRNFNRAKILFDQEKIYIPSAWEINNGYFFENVPTVISTTSNQGLVTSSDLININTASLDELDTLPGVGKVTADKIVSNRPFRALDELMNKKVISKSVFENIINLIEL